MIFVILIYELVFLVLFLLLILCLPVENYMSLIRKLFGIRSSQLHLNNKLLDECFLQGRLDVVQTLLQAGAEVNWRSSAYSGKSAIEIATGWGNINLFNLLVSKGARVENDSILFYAVYGMNLEIIKILLKRFKIEVDIRREPDGLTPLAVACLYGDDEDERLIDIVNFLIHSGSDVNTRDNDGCSLLMLLSASEKNLFNEEKDESIFEILIKHGADINAQDPHGKTALMYAAEKDNKYTLKRLLEAGASTNIKDNIDKGRTVFSYTKNPLILNILKRHKTAKKNSFYNNTHWFDAAITGDVVLIKKYLKKGISIDVTDEDGDTALIIASSYGYLNVVDLLIKKGANVNFQNDKGRTAVMTASSKGEIATLDLLIKAKAKINMQDEDGSTAVMKALNINTIKYLLKNRANIEICTNDRKDLIDSLIIDFRNRIKEIIYIFKEFPQIVSKNGGWYLANAASYGNLHVVKLLIGYGVNVNSENALGKAISGYCMSGEKSKEHLKVLKYLSINGATASKECINMINNHGIKTLLKNIKNNND